MDRKSHWEQIYSTKKSTEVSWYQDIPLMSLHMFGEANLDSDAQVIDVGGGDSFLIDTLLEKTNYQLQVLDISANAIQRAKSRIGEPAERVEWIVSDVLDFRPAQQFDFWHDRAVFHFLTNPAEIDAYVHLVTNSVRVGGYLMIATFSDQGPLKCSGIEVSRYSLAKLTATFESGFELVCGLNANHPTPFDTLQNFSFCLFRRVSE